LIGAIRRWMHERKATKAAAKGLEQKFREVNLKFMELPPLVQRALMQDAISYGVEKAIAIFKELATHAQSQGATNAEKSLALLELYRARAAAEAPVR
jgi:hypothetical protein